jgi:hypothetical protein
MLAATVVAPRVHIPLHNTTPSSTSPVTQDISSCRDVCSNHGGNTSAMDAVFQTWCTQNAECNAGAASADVAQVATSLVSATTQSLPPNIATMIKEWLDKGAPCEWRVDNDAAVTDGANGGAIQYWTTISAPQSRHALVVSFSAFTSTSPAAAPAAASTSTAVSSRSVPAALPNTSVQMTSNNHTVPTSNIGAHSDLYNLLARQAASMSGLVYGGYVRDHVIRKSFKEVSDMDIWFQSSQWFNTYKEYLIKEHGARVAFPGQSMKAHYPFQRLRMNIVFGDDDYVNLVLILSQDFPVNDFDANLLTWNGFWVDIQQPSARNYDDSGETTAPVFVVEQVIASVARGEMTPFPTYISKCVSTLKQLSALEAQHNRRVQ